MVIVIGLRAWVLGLPASGSRSQVEGESVGVWLGSSGIPETLQATSLLVG